ncbi:hypothetical protein HPP92_003086 [Vanilla planifolia]|uniref:Uncharacterized protein n=1 Tax=Vanilla planifolia TaxID=51239 RepID=A0A835S2L9_VANPL|nr:hypothetical protein HPP92_003086 [Vanilla planifolia]
MPPSDAQQQPRFDCSSKGWTLAMNSKKERIWGRAQRSAKAAFFVANMLASLFFDCAPPLLVVLIDLVLPSVLLAATGNGKAFSVPALASEFRNYRFQVCLVDLPSSPQQGFYFCFSGRGPYLAVTTLCASASAGFVSLKAIAMFGSTEAPGKRHLLSIWVREGPVVEALFFELFGSRLSSRGRRIQDQLSREAQAPCIQN